MYKKGMHSFTFDTSQICHLNSDWSALPLHHSYWLIFKHIESLGKCRYLIFYDWHSALYSRQSAFVGKMPSPRTPSLLKTVSLYEHTRGNKMELINNEISRKRTGWSTREYVRVIRKSRLDQSDSTWEEGLTLSYVYDSIIGHKHKVLTDQYVDGLMRRSSDPMWWSRGYSEVKKVGCALWRGSIYWMDICSLLDNKYRYFFHRRGQGKSKGTLVWMLSTTSSIWPRTRLPPIYTKNIIFNLATWLI